MCMAAPDGAASCLLHYTTAQRPNPFSLVMRIVLPFLSSECFGCFKESGRLLLPNKQGVTGAADFYYSTLTQFRSCHSNISVYAPAISITATATAAAAAATNAFIRILPAENAGCQMLLLERLCFAEIAAR
jgi:hypothetical protein